MPDHKYYAAKKEGTVLFCDGRNFTSLFEDEATHKWPKIVIEKSGSAYIYYSYTTGTF